MKIKRIKPEELSSRQIYCLKFLYCTEPGDFAVIADSKGARNSGGFFNKGQADSETPD